MFLVARSLIRSFCLVSPNPFFQIRHRFGLYDEITTVNGRRVRHCNWIRFLRVSETYGPQVNVVCAKVKGEPIYEIVKPIPSHQELVVYYLPEGPEELFFIRMRSQLYRQTMDSILEGKLPQIHPTKEITQ